MVFPIFVSQIRDSRQEQAVNYRRGLQVDYKKKHKFRENAKQKIRHEL